ncbi:MAG TPA: helix-turn-helix transcriptional regulator [Kofleriaceae bacterium]|nr:helix-turn-helix transcriptional regulator [Kofleriaceae bacterium]
MPRKSPPPSTAETVVRFVGERLRQLREERGMTQEALGARAQVSSKFIGQIERGSTNVSATVLAQLSIDGLGVALDQFFAPNGPSGVDADVAAVTAVVTAQKPAVRRIALRVLRSLFGGLGEILDEKSRSS